MYRIYLIGMFKKIIYGHRRSPLGQLFGALLPWIKEEEKMGSTPRLARSLDLYPDIFVGVCSSPCLTISSIFIDLVYGCIDVAARCRLYEFLILCPVDKYGYYPDRRLFTQKSSKRKREDDSPYFDFEVDSFQVWWESMISCMSSKS